MSEMNSEIMFLVYVVFGSFGLGYFVYGKKQKKTVPLVSGIVLMVYPYFVSNSILLVVIGLVFMGLPFVVSI